MSNSAARKLRKNQTEAEKKLWKVLRNKQLEGLKFRRQFPFGRYVADFVCNEKKLVVEVDGGQHANQGLEDKKRTKFFEEEGYQVLRFWNNEVLVNIEGVMEIISINIK